MEQSFASSSKGEDYNPRDDSSFFDKFDLDSADSRSEIDVVVKKEKQPRPVFTQPIPIGSHVEKVNGKLTVVRDVPVKKEDRSSASSQHSDKNTRSGRPYGTSDTQPKK